MKARMQNHILLQTGLCVTLNGANDSLGHDLAAEEEEEEA